MATLQTIRTRAGLLIAIIIGISLAAFILGDLLQSGSSIMNKNHMKIGEINGETIQYPEFQRKVEELGEIYKQNTQQSQLDENSWVQVREQTWQTTVQNIVMSDVYKDLGLEVSSDELYDMLQGANLHPIIQQLFRDPNTGQVNRGAVVNFLKQLDTNVAPEQKAYWLYLENQIVSERTQSKYTNMVGKGLFVTSTEAQQSIADASKQISFDYISLNNNIVADSAVKVTDSELKAYYNEHKKEFKQEKIRDLEYITFNVKPSAADYNDAEKWITEIKDDFANTTDNEQFVNSNSDINYDGTWYKLQSLPENVGVWITENNPSATDVFGPYFENESYSLAKLDSMAMLPDSVQARHILLKPNSQEELASMQLLADSLKTAIEKGSNFAALAMQFSTDQGSAMNGGDLGWFGRGQMVKSFEEAAFKNAKNEVSIVPSQFGIHIVQTTDRGKLTQQYRVATLVRKVQPSTRTYQDTYALASKFASANTDAKKFEEAIVAEKLNKRVASVRENDREIAGLENARVLIRAAYEADKGDILATTQGSPIFELGNNFVIAVLTKATEEGESTFEEAKTKVELAVTKEKKTEYLVKKAAGALDGKTDLQAVASQLNTSVQNAANINFNSFSIPGIGMEPAVVGTVAALETDKISRPVGGNNGVYIVKVTSVNQGSEQSLEAEQARLAQSFGYRATSQAYEAQRKKADIEDLRAKFY
ncbi:MAG TPA: SurA N-terminal domain-containing protein [Draconibacterium sp.]|nr:SurA N-terminal domain-containing protein [Draconibacterium sp.]